MKDYLKCQTVRGEKRPHVVDRHYGESQHVDHIAKSIPAEAGAVAVGVDVTKAEEVAVVVVNLPNVNSNSLQFMVRLHQCSPVDTLQIKNGEVARHVETVSALRSLSVPK